MNRDDFTARVIREMIAGGRRAAVDKPLPSMPLPPSPAPPPPLDPVATGAYIVAAGRRRRGEDNPIEERDEPRAPGSLILDAVKRQQEGK